MILDILHEIISLPLIFLIAYGVIWFYTSCRIATIIAYRDNHHSDPDVGEILFFLLFGGIELGFLWPFVAIYLLGRRYFNFIIYDVLFVSPDKKARLKRQKREAKETRSENKQSRLRELVWRR
jgi:hypothetical protein